MAGRRDSYRKRSHSQMDYHSENGGGKRKYSGEDRELYSPESNDTVYRYLCPGRKIGSIIGKGGDIVKQLRQETQSKIRIGDTVSGCDERVVTVFSSREETNSLDAAEDGDGDHVCPAHDALFKIHERLVADDLPRDDVTARLLVPTDQIGSIIGKGGEIIQSIRDDTGAKVRILKNEHLPLCAMRSDELLQITGEPSVVRKALHRVACRLHDNPSRSQHLLFSSLSNSQHQSGEAFMGPNAGAPVVGLTPLLGPYGGYKGEPGGEWPSRLYYPPKEETFPEEFSIRLVCSSSNVGGVIGKAGGVINQIRQESGANINVGSSSIEEDECIITVSAVECFEDPISPTIEALVRLQPKCSARTERENGEISYMTRLLVPTTRIGCLIGKGGSIINDMRRATRANIRIFSKDNLPKVASEDDELVQIGGDIESAKNALVQVAIRLKANVFEREGSLPALFPAVPYFPPHSHGENMDNPSYGGRDSRSNARGSMYGSGYSGPSEFHHSDSYGGYGGLQGGEGGYPLYGYSNRSGSGLSGQNSMPHGKHHGYYRLE